MIITIKAKRKSHYGIPYAISSWLGQEEVKGKNLMLQPLIFIWMQE